jgi:hypothetical protein
MAESPNINIAFIGTRSGYRRRPNLAITPSEVYRLMNLPSATS